MERNAAQQIQLFRLKKDYEEQVGEIISRLDDLKSDAKAIKEKLDSG